MKPLPRPIVLPLLFASLGLIGSGGALSYPSRVVSPQVQGFPAQGRVYGGFALIAGSNDPSGPAGSRYLAPDSSAQFNLGGACNCTVAQPAYFYSYSQNAPTTTYAISQIVVSNATTGANGTATYTFTVSPAETLTAGQSVTISGLTGNFTNINNVAPVLADNLTATTFSITATDIYGSSFNYPFGARYSTIANGTYGTTGPDGFGANGVVAVSSTAPTANPAIQVDTFGGVYLITRVISAL